MENTQNIELFDDFLDIKDVFKESTADKEQKIKEAKEKDLKDEKIS